MVTAGLLVAVSTAVDGARFGTLLGEVRPWGVVAAASLLPLQIALAATRWRAANASLGLTMDAGEAFAETGLAALLNQLLPSGLAGEVTRVWRQQRPDRPTPTVLAAAVTDRGLGLATFVVALTASLIAWPLLHPGTPPLLPVGGAGMLAAAGIGLLAVPASVPGLGPVVDAVRRAVSDHRHVGVFVVTSIGFLAAILLQAHLCAWALGLHAGLPLLALLPLYLVSMLVPLSVGGWGPKEVAAVGLFPLLGWSSTEAAAFSTLFGLTTLLGATVFAPVALFEGRS